jgi:hypothetical protein
MAIVDWGLSTGRDLEMNKGKQVSDVLDKAETWRRNPERWDLELSGFGIRC